MTSTIGLLFGAGLLVGVALCSICVWAPRRASVKVAALALAALFVPLGYGSMMELMSRPKPVEFEWWLGRADEATVLASDVQEGKGIYLWLQVGNDSEPRAYVLPWRRDLAEQLQKAKQDAESAQGGVAMRRPFEPSLDDDKPIFYALPQPAMPPKEATEPPAERYPHPGMKA